MSARDGGDGSETREVPFRVDPDLIAGQGLAELPADWAR